jgi:hypothetical protein
VYGQAPSRVRYKALPLVSHGSCIRRWVALSSWSMTCNVRCIGQNVGRIVELGEAWPHGYGRKSWT